MSSDTPERIAELQGQLLAHQQGMSAAYSNAVEVASYFEHEAEQSQARLTDEAPRRAAAENQVADLTSEVTSLTKQNAFLSSHNSGLTSHNAALTSQNEGLKQRSEQQQQQQLAAAAAVGAPATASAPPPTVSLDSSQQQVRVDELTRRNEQLNAHNEDLKQQLQRQSDELASVTRQLTASFATFQSFEQQLQAKESLASHSGRQSEEIIAELRGKLAAKERERETLQQALKIATQPAHSATVSAAQDRELSRALDRAEWLHSQNVALEEDLEAERVRAASGQRRATKLDAQVSAVRSQLASAQLEAQTAATNASAARQELENQLRAEMASAAAKHQIEVTLLRQVRVQLIGHARNNM